MMNDNERIAASQRQFVLVDAVSFIP